MLKYDRKSAVEYARRYALNYNPKYFHFNGIGGDCTNFVSQCLLAGGGVMNYNQYYGWYYIDKDNRAPSWTSVKYLKRFLLSNSRPGFIAEIVPISEVMIGDIIQIRQNPDTFNHTVIVSKIENGEIFVCSHSYDAEDKALRAYQYQEVIGIHIVGINE